MEQLSQLELETLCLLLLRYLDSRDLMDPTSRVLMGAWLKLKRRRR